MARRLVSVVLCALLGSFASGCGKVDHESIDEWRETERGPGKLRDALANDELDAELRAHAAQNLIQLNEWPAVEQRLSAIPERDRQAVVARLAARLQQDATVPEGYSPSRLHAAAKDALFTLRPHADEATRDGIDAYLADWLGVNFNDRVRRGSVDGVEIVEHIGGKAAPRLMAEARSIIAAPPDDQGRIPMFSDELLKSLAYTGDAAAVGLLIDLARNEHPEPSLQRRAMAALFVAYIDDLEQPKPSPAGLKPHVQHLASIVRDYSQSGGNINDAFALLAAAGAPECVEPLRDLVASPREEEAFLWAAVQKGILCTGAEGVGQMIAAMPTDRAYERAILEKYLWDKMLKLGSRTRLAESCRQMLQAQSWVSRATGVECLARIGEKRDVEAISALAGDRTALRGWWGPQDDVPKAQRRRDPTLGSVAQEVAKKL